VEDDFAFCGKFRLPAKFVNDYVNARIEAYNLTTEEKFTLQQTSFNLSGIPLVNFQQVIDLESPVFPSLPTTSVKRNARLVNDSSASLGINYGVRIYFPFIYRWEYWIAQLNANADKTKPFSERLKVLQPLLKNATGMVKVFGTENVVAGQILLENTERLEDLTKKMHTNGVAQEQANERTNTLGHSLMELKNTFVGLFTEISANDGVMQIFINAIKFLKENQTKRLLK
jgi:hypothetical protein